MQPDPGQEPEKISPEEPADRNAQDHTRVTQPPEISRRNTLQQFTQQATSQQATAQQPTSQQPPQITGSRQPQTLPPTSELPRAPRIENFVAGTLLENQYEIVRRIGTGGMGSVYKCIDKMTSRTVAVKILRQEHATNNKIMQRFQREAQAIASLEHPHLVKLYSFYFNDLMPLLIMEYVDGKPLDQILERDGAMSIERSLKLAMQICDALSYVHKSGIIHRDLKPSNIIVKKSLTGEDIAKVVDFGIAKIKDVQTTTTSTGEIFGSPSYMSPEQAMGREAGEAADQYALGCVLFECLTGLKPFISDNVLAVMMQHIRDEPPTLKIGSLGKDFPPELEAIVKRMMEKEPERRFSSIAAVRDALSGKKIEPLTRNAVATNSTSRIVTGNPFLFGTIVSASTLLVVALVGGGWTLFQKAHPLSTQETNFTAHALEAEQSLSQPPSLGEFGVDAFDSPAALILFLKAKAHENKVEVLDVYRNSLSSEAMNILSNIPQINILSLAFCTKMNLLKDLKSPTIQDLNLSSTDVDDASIKYLTNLPHLETLRLDGCLHLTPKGYAALRELKSLRQLRVTEAILTDDGVKELSKIPNLSVLFVNNQRLTNKCFSYFADMPNLLELDFRGTNPDGKFAELKKLKKLKLMSLGNIVLKETDVKDLEQLKTLVNLRMFETNLTEAQARELVNALPNLTTVDFDCPQISKRVSRELQQSLARRRALEPGQ